MFKKRSPENQLEERIKQFEKETFERGLVEHRPPTHENDQQATAGKSSDKLRLFKKKRRANNRLRVLIIDDEIQFRTMLRQFLASMGYEVIEAANGDEGVKLFFEKPADLVISDIIMPEKEGIETVMEIKRQFPNAKVIVVSGGGWYGTDVDFDMAEKLGALTLKKPFELQELSDAIQKLLN
jgi:response regulator RpfG family c-di-GMP phosphodiesterase